MKPLFLILLAGFLAQAQAQTIADFARQERARKAKVQSRVITTEDLKRVIATPAAAPAGAEAPKESAKEPTTEKAASTEPSSAEIKEWIDELAKVRAKVRELLDLETTMQLQINDLINKVYAPVTSEAARDQAQAALAAAQRKLADTRADIVVTRIKLQDMELKGPPKK